MLNTFKAFAGKRVFVTGHTGFKGAWLTEWLLRLGADVAGYSIDVPTEPSLFKVLGLEGRMHHQFGDICDFATLHKAVSTFDPEFVFHMAAQPLVRLSYDEPVRTFQTNILGTAHVLEALRGLKNLRAAVMITTDKVYEAAEAAEPFRETDRLGGHDPYSSSKAACEIVINSYYRSFFAHVRERVGLGSVRAGNVIGGGDYSVDRLIPDAVRAWLAGKPLVIRSPEAVRPWQHVLEPLSGYLAFAQRLAAEPTRYSGEAYNFGPPDEKGGTVGEVTRTLQQRWQGFEVQVDRSQTGTKKETHVLRLNWGKANRDLGWAPKLPLADALDWTSAWYETFRSNPSKIADFTRQQIAQYESRIR